MPLVEEEIGDLIVVDTGIIEDMGSTVNRIGNTGMAAILGQWRTLDNQGYSDSGG